jgi:hypothetical protein
MTANSLALNQADIDPHFGQATRTLQYQIAPEFALAKELTLTGTHQVADQWNAEYRRDFSNSTNFYTANPLIRQNTRNTAALDLIWWFGGKTGSW